MSDTPSNGHPEFEPNGVPRIAPPEGQRAARGAFSTAPRDESTVDFSNERSNEFSTYSDDEPAVDFSNARSSDYSAEHELTVADVPSVEDEYSIPLVVPPLGIDPEDDPADRRYNPNRREDTPRDVELGLMAHLTELRQRLINCTVIVLLAMMITWHFTPQIQDWFARPILKVLLAKHTPGVPGGNQLMSSDPMGFFTVYFQFSMVSALIVTMPLLFWQAWRFIEPALTISERRYALILVPFSSILFFLGAGLGYAVSPLFYQFFIAFQPSGVAALWDYSQIVVLMAKMLLVFGITFEVPVIIIFLNKLGILTRNVLIEYWRHAVIIIFTVVAILTPTWDPVTLTVCATPPCLLYVLSIWLVKWL